MTADVGRLFELYYESLVRMLHRRTGDRDRAEDLAQETFARAVAAPPLNPRPWLFAVALNLVREDGRRSVRQGRRLQLLKAEGFNYDEIAEALGLAKGAVGTTLARARRRLVESYRAREVRRDAAS